MKSKWLSVAILSAVMVAPVSADDARTKKKKGKRDRQRGMTTQLIKRLDAVKLTDEQVGKIKELGKVANGKAKEIRAEVGLTNELMKTRAVAQKSLKDSGKKGKELMAAANEKAGLTEEQAKALKSVNGIRMKLQKDVIALLTDEQKKDLPEKMLRAQGKRKGKGKKKKAA
jgi:Spy/CpxP family protein refolding chaperone